MYHILAGWCLEKISRPVIGNIIIFVDHNDNQFWIVNLSFHCYFMIINSNSCNSQTLTLIGLRGPGRKNNNELSTFHKKCQINQLVWMWCFEYDHNLTTPLLWPHTLDVVHIQHKSFRTLSNTKQWNKTVTKQVIKDFFNKS